MAMVEVTISTRCYATEDREKVGRAIRNIFPEADVQGVDPIIAQTHSLEMFSDLLKRQRIRDAARAVLRRSLKRGSATFMLNKQVAFVGKISFSEESHALGDIEVRMSSQDLQTLIDSIDPETRQESAK
jgi:predicted RNA binding protein with dsRBD fold (UPF0201 family)